VGGGRERDFIRPPHGSSLVNNKQETHNHCKRLMPENTEAVVSFKNKFSSLVPVPIITVASCVEGLIARMYARTQKVNEQHQQIQEHNALSLSLCFSLLLFYQTSPSTHKRERQRAQPTVQRAQPWHGRTCICIFKAEFCLWVCVQQERSHTSSTRDGRLE
jgi:hypothetical protein